MSTECVGGHGITPFTREGSAEPNQDASDGIEVARHLGTSFSVARAVGTAVARPLHTGKVTGSIPVPPTSDEPTILFLTADAARRGADRGLVVQSAYIYVIEAIGLDLFKIGMAVDFRARFSSYRTECPVPCRPLIIAAVPKADVQKIESALHAHYQDRRRKGEWFALTPEDIDGLEAAIKKASCRALRKLSREATFGGYCRYHPESAEKEANYEATLARMEAENAVPTDEHIIDRITYYTQELGKFADARDLTRDIDRRPQAVHEALRYLLLAGAVALVSPRRHPSTGSIWFEDYRVCDLIIPNATCDWERTSCGREIQVSEPLGDIVPEFYGHTRW